MQFRALLLDALHAVARRWGVDQQALEVFASFPPDDEAAPLFPSRPCWRAQLHGRGKRAYFRGWHRSSLW